MIQFPEHELITDLYIITVNIKAMASNLQGMASNLKAIIFSELPSRPLRNLFNLFGATPWPRQNAASVDHP